MNIRATIVCSCMLVGACGPSSGGSTDTAASTDATSTTTGGATSTGGTTTTGTSGETTPTTGTDVTTGATTDATTTGTTDATTSTTGGPLVCDDIVGSRDCAALVAVSGDLTMETCLKCQGVGCGQEPECDTQFPCDDDLIVIQGCCSDEDCEGLTPFCGMFIAADNVCVLNDDV